MIEMASQMNFDIYTSVKSKRLFTITQKLIDNEYTQVLGYLSFDYHLNNILDSLYEYFPCTTYIGFWCKMTICLNILCLKSYIFDIFLSNSPVRISQKKTQFELKYDIQRVITYCENESDLYTAFLHHNYKFYRYFCLLNDFEEVEILELYQFMSAFLDVKTCCNVLLLHFRK